MPEPIVGVIEPVVENPAESVTEGQIDYAAKDKKEDNGEKEKVCPKCGKPLDECTCGDKKEEPKEENPKEKKKYVLEEVEEYQDLVGKYSQLENDYNELKTNFDALTADKDTLTEQVNSLTEFKLGVERKEKEELINSFYMLSDEDKADVVANIENYSLDDIEAKLSIICVRNKVSFNLEDDTKPKAETTFNLSSTVDEDVPAWIKAVKNTADNKN